MIRSSFSTNLAALLLLLFGANFAWADNPANTPAAGGNDPYAVPTGNSQVLAAFLQQLMQVKPKNAEEITKLNEAKRKAAEKLLAAKPNNEQLQLAVKAKSSALQDPTELAAFEEEMKKGGKKPLARIVHSRLLTVKLDQTVTKIPEFRKVAEEVKTFLGGVKQFQLGDEQLIKHVCTAAEDTGDNKLAGEMYDEMAGFLPKQMPFSSMALDMQACARRFKLPGNPMRLEARSLEGKAISLTGYKGKVVLVDFWATWCPPCRAEIPNIKQAYTNFHDKGFEVIGVSIDTCPLEELQNFLKKEEVPWTICRDIDTPGKNADYYGIHLFPTMILIGRDGRVISLTARGAGLGPLVEKALSASAVATDDKAPAGDKNSSGGDASVKKEKGKPKADETAKKKADDAPKAAPAESRQWNDASGKFAVKAKFRGIINQKVKLECDDGRTINIPLKDLSDDDQNYIKKRKSGGT